MENREREGQSREKNAKKEEKGFKTHVGSIREDAFSLSLFFVVV